jgi:hypothetical protein
VSESDLTGFALAREHAAHRTAAARKRNMATAKTLEDD